MASRRPSTSGLLQALEEAHRQRAWRTVVTHANQLRRAGIATEAVPRVAMIESQARRMLGYEDPERTTYRLMCASLENTVGGEGLRLALIGKLAYLELHADPEALAWWSNELTGVFEALLAAVEVVSDLTDIHDAAGDCVATLIAGAVSSGHHGTGRDLAAKWLPRTEAVLGKCSPAALGLRVNLSTLLINAEDIEGVLPVLQDPLKWECFDMGTYEGASLMWNLAGVHLRLNQTSLAEALLREVVSARSRHVDEGADDELLGELQRALHDTQSKR